MRWSARRPPGRGGRSAHGLLTQRSVTASGPRAGPESACRAARAQGRRGAAAPVQEERECGAGQGGDAEHREVRAVRWHAGPSGAATTAAAGATWRCSGRPTVRARSAAGDLLLKRRQRRRGAARSAWQCGNPAAQVGPSGRASRRSAIPVGHGCVERQVAGVGSGQLGFGRGGQPGACRARSRTVVGCRSLRCRARFAPCRAALSLFLLCRITSGPSRWMLVRRRRVRPSRQAAVPARAGRRCCLRRPCRVSPLGL